MTHKRGLDFTDKGKLLGSGMGFLVNKP